MSIHNSLSGWFSRTLGSRQIHARRRNGRGACIETLEIRTLLTANTAPVLNPSGFPTFDPIAEAANPATNFGDLVSDLIYSMGTGGGGITDTDPNALQGIAVTFASSSKGTWEFSLDNGLTWSAITGSTAHPQTFASDDSTRIRFNPNLKDFGTVSLTFHAWDQTAGTNGGLLDSNATGGSTSLSTLTDEAYLTVVPVNEAPVLDPSGVPSLNPIPTNVSDQSNTGTTISDIIARMNPGGITDGDPLDERGIAITFADQSFGTWQFTIDGGSNWYNIGQPTVSNARLLAADSYTRVRFVPVSGYSGVVRFTFQAWDRFSGSNGYTASTTAAGGSNPFSLLSDEARLVVGTPEKKATIGVFRSGSFYLDTSRNRQWDGTSGGDTAFSFASATLTPIAGDWNGDGRTDIGVYKDGQFYLDNNGNRIFESTSFGDAYFGFGTAGDTPITGDWNGDGKTDIGIWRAGKFYLDLNGNRKWDGPGSGGDIVFGFGSVTDTPITGDWNGDGITDIGIFRAGTFYLDANGNREWNGTTTDAMFGFSAATDTPITGDWNGDGITDVGVFRGGTFYLDNNGNRRWDSIGGGDEIRGFSAATDIPIIGVWAPQNLSSPTLSSALPSTLVSSQSPTTTTSTQSAAPTTSESTDTNVIASLIAPKTRRYRGD